MTGGDKGAGFASPEFIFVSNVINGTEATSIQDHMKMNGLNILTIEKVSHQEARNFSFKISVSFEDREKALSSDIWPVGVRVRQYRHYRTRDQVNREQRGGQFSNGRVIIHCFI